MYQNFSYEALPNRLNDSKTICQIINTLRAANPEVMMPLFMRGQCYQLFLLLRLIYPAAVAWYDYVEGHIYTKIGCYWYDIRGVHYRLNSNCKPFDFDCHDPPHRWGKRDKRCLVMQTSTYRC